MYDGANRMKQAQQVGASGTTTISTYFGSLRIKKAVGSTTTLYIYSGGRPIAEYVNGSTTPTKEYIYTGARLLATITGTNIIYHHPDHLSDRAETDANGNPVRTFGHFPYGEVWYESASDPWKFTTYFRDSGLGETGLDYAVARFSSSSLGRFASPDPLVGSILKPQSMNRYAYVTNDPVNLTDPLGLAGGNWACRLLDYGDCAGGDYAGLNATAGMGLWADPFGEWVDPTHWDPMAEGYALYDLQVKFNQTMNTYSVEQLVVRNNSDGTVTVWIPNQPTANPNFDPHKPTDENNVPFVMRASELTLQVSKPPEKPLWAFAMYPGMSPQMQAKIAGAARRIKVAIEPGLRKGVLKLKEEENVLKKLMESIAEGISEVGGDFFFVIGVDAMYCQASGGHWVIDDNGGFCSRPQTSGM